MELATSWRYLAPASRIHVGMGALSQLYGEVRRAGAMRAFVVCSNTVAHHTNLLDRVKEALGDLFVGSYDGAVRESPIPKVMAGVEAARAANPEALISVGGGSAIVTTRAIGILLAEGGTVYDHYTRHVPGQPPQVQRMLKPKLPQMLVMTTPTTGADRGGAAVYDEQPPHRKELYDPRTRPAAIFVDGEALLTAPLDLFRDTSMSTFSGFIGSLQTPSLSPFQYADLRQGFELCLEHFPQVVARPNDALPRMQIVTAALLANRASQSTYAFGPRGGRSAGGLGRQLRYRYRHIGQGASGAVMLLADLRLNRDENLEAQAHVAGIMGVRKPGVSDRAAAEALEEAVSSFLRSVGMPTRLRDLNVPREDFTILAETSVAEPGFTQNPRGETTPTELMKVLEAAW
ncbi:MAG: iron-containing alcohol dehydrogenase [Chloroflexi bacterium]|nr:iron-containing alcohol dehydrogenase [Chloroflexota bacterium]